MAGVVFVFVREDASEVETLAEAFDDAGYSITGNENAELCVIVWSRRALRSEAFRAAADEAFRTGRAIVAALITPPRNDVFAAPVVDLSQWDGVETLALAPLFELADEIVHPVEASVIALPLRPLYLDAEFVEVQQPAKALRAVREEPTAAPKLGAPMPRRDFRRIGARRQRGREHAALVFAVIAILGGGAFVASVAANTVSYVQESKAEQGGAVSLTSASSEAIGLEDTVFDAPAQIGHRGVEPPSAHSASYRPQEERR